MALSQFNFLKDDTRVIKYQDTAIKVKLFYHDCSKEKFAKLTPKQCHDELEDVLRAVLYADQRHQWLPIIKTQHFLVTVKKKIWKTAEKISFTKDDKDIKCSQHLYEFIVESKDSRVSKSKVNQEVTPKAARKTTPRSAKQSHGKNKKECKVVIERIDPKLCNITGENHIRDANEKKILRKKSPKPASYTINDSESEGDDDLKSEKSDHDSYVPSDESIDMMKLDEKESDDDDDQNMNKQHNTEKMKVRKPGKGKKKCWSHRKTHGKKNADEASDISSDSDSDLSDNDVEMSDGSFKPAESRRKIKKIRSRVKKRESKRKMPGKNENFSYSEKSDDSDEIESLSSSNSEDENDNKRENLKEINLTAGAELRNRKSKSANPSEQNVGKGLETNQTRNLRESRKKKIIYLEETESSDEPTDESDDEHVPSNEPRTDKNAKEKEVTSHKDKGENIPKKQNKERNITDKKISRKTQDRISNKPKLVEGSDSCDGESLSGNRQQQNKERRSCRKRQVNRKKMYVNKDVQSDEDSDDEISDDYLPSDESNDMSDEYCPSTKISHEKKQGARQLRNTPAVRAKRGKENIEGDEQYDSERDFVAGKKKNEQNKQTLLKQKDTKVNVQKVQEKNRKKKVVKDYDENMNVENILGATERKRKENMKSKQINQKSRQGRKLFTASVGLLENLPSTEVRNEDLVTQKKGKDSKSLHKSPKFQPEVIIEDCVHVERDKTPKSIQKSPRSQPNKTVPEKLNSDDSDMEISVERGQNEETEPSETGRLDRLRFRSPRSEGRHVRLRNRDRYLIQQEELEESMKLQHLTKSDPRPVRKSPRKRGSSSMWDLVDTIITPIKRLVTK